MTATKEAIAQVLNGVIDPNTGKGLQDSGEIASVLPGAVIIELGYPAKSQIELIKKAAEDALRAAGIDSEVEVRQNIRAHKVRSTLRVLPNVKNIIAVSSGKGGVGKSFVTGAIATELARHGHKVGVLDADITGPSIPKMFGMSGRHVHALGNLMLPEISEHGVKVMSSNLLLQNETDPVLWRGPVIAGAIRQFWSETSWGPIDYLLVDMPPGTGDVALTVFQSLPVDGIVIVTSPQDLVSMIVAKAVNMAEKNVPILGIVENMSYIECPDCGKKIEVFGKSKLPEVAERYNLDILGQLPINPALAEACDKGEVETALPDGMLPKAVSAVEAITPHETDEA